MACRIRPDPIKGLEVKQLDLTIRIFFVFFVFVFFIKINILLEEKLKKKYLKYNLSY
jgi:hypothetical protein